MILGVAVMGIMYNFFKAKFLRQLVERAAADNPRTHLGKKTLWLGREGLEQEICHYGTQNGIAKIFKALVAQPVISNTFTRCRFMGEGKFIKRDVTRGKTKNVLDIIRQVLVFCLT